jgi:hypothetical protein
MGQGKKMKFRNLQLIVSVLLIFGIAITYGFSPEKIVHLMAPRPFSINAQKQFVYVTEVWKLSNDGKSISVQANAKSTLFGGERSWKTAYTL